MRQSALLLLAMVSILTGHACGEESSNAAANVNSRYIVESVELLPERKSVSASLRDAMTRLIGKKLDQAQLDDVGRLIKRELRVGAIIQTIKKGTKPEHVRVFFETQRRKSDFDVNLPKLAYHSKHGFTASAEATATVLDNRFSFGLTSDGDSQVERFAGINLRYERTRIFTDRVQFQLNVGSYHNIWNGATVLAVDQDTDVPGIYRTRHNIQPTLTFTVAPGLELAAGVSFQQFQLQFPAAQTEASNASITTLRYRRDWGPRETRHSLDAGYSLRAATKMLDSDFVYARHEANARYGFSGEDEGVVVKFGAGELSGRAPMFDRFVLGNARTLRGWNKYDLTPLGAERVVYGSAEFHLHSMFAFYDTGAAWQGGAGAPVRHSAGVGIDDDGKFFLAVAFPIRDGRVSPMFMAGFFF